MYFFQVRRMVRAACAALAAGVMIGILVPASVFSAPSDSCQAGSTSMSDGGKMMFRLYVPRTISKDKRYPLVMCLHGIGECGTDNRAQVDRENMDGQWKQDSVKKKYSPFILYPQCPSSSYEWGYFNTGNASQKGYAGLPAVAAVKVIDSLIKIYPIDTTRLYVGGLSWGGIGTEGLMMSYPDKFAAAFPCAGENKLNTVAVMTKTPFWIFHGASDGTVPATLDRALVTAVEQAGTPVVRYLSGPLMANPTGISADSLMRAITRGALYLYAEVNNGNHNSGWNEAFVAPQLVPYLMSKSKVDKKTVFTWPPPGPADLATPVRLSATKAATGGALTVAGTTIRWNNIARLPASMEVLSAKGSLVKQVAIRSATGEMACSGLPAGVYMVKIASTGIFADPTAMLTVLP
jgi:poly(3-hydroxybutyrate) depolymerase